MDLRKASDGQKLSLCRKYFYGGFAFLPFLWLVNGIWFFKYAFLSPSFDEQPAIRKYVIGSLAGSLVWLIIFVTWTAVFQTYRVSWGETGDDITFVLPKGMP